MAPKARQRAAPGLTVPQLLNEAQRCTSETGLVRYARMLWDLYAEDAVATYEQLLACVKWVLKLCKEKSVFTQRVVHFVGVLVRLAGEPHEGPPREELVQLLAAHLEDLSSADDQTARWRACQLLEAVLVNVSDEVELVDEVIEAVQRALLERLGDAKPAVRVAAARALKRLPTANEDGEYDSCPVTQALLETLECDKNKEVRKAVLASLPLLVAGSEPPQACLSTVPHVLARTLDEADEVRKVAYLGFKCAEVPLSALGLEQRLLVLRRGLADRSPAVVNVATSLLSRWLAECCGGEVLELLRHLAVEQRTDVAEAAVRALIASGDLNAVQLCKQGAEAGTGLRADFSREGAKLLSPEEALLWRVVCEELYGEATSKGLAAAAAAGMAATIEAAAAGERYSALEDAVPASAEDMAAIIACHALAGPQHRFTACQLMLLAGTCMDFADAMSRKAAAALLHNLLVDVPSEDQEGGGMGEPGSTAWRQALGRFLCKVHAEPAEMAEALLPTIGQLTAAAEQDANPAGTSWLHALGAAALLLENLPDARPAAHAAAEFGLLDLLQRLVVPAMHHDIVQVRCEAVHCLGLYCLLDHIETDLGKHLKALRAAVLAWSPAGGAPAEVALAAVQALGDIALRKGVKNLDSFLESDAAPSDPTLDPELLGAPLLDVLLCTLQRWEEGLETLAKPAKRKAKSAATSVEAQLALGAGLAEALAKLVLHNNSWVAYSAATGQLGGLEDEEVLKVLVRLLLLNFDPAAEPASQLRQCLAVFFDKYADMPLPRQQPPHSSRAYLSYVLLPAAHCAAERELEAGKRITAANCMSAKVMRFVLQLLEAPARGADGQEEVVSQEELACSVLAEVIQCCALDMPKPYLATLVKLPLRLPVLATPETQVVIKGAQALAQRALGLLRDRLMRKDMEAVLERLSGLDTSQGEPLSEEEVELLLESMRQGNGPLPFAAADTPATAPARKATKTPARGRGQRKAAPSSSEDESEAEEEEDENESEQPADSAAPPATASRRMPARAARTTRNMAERSRPIEAEDGSDSEASGSDEGSGSSSSEEDEVENSRRPAAGRRGGSKGRRTSMESVSELRRALQENRIS